MEWISVEDRLPDKTDLNNDLRGARCIVYGVATCGNCDAKPRITEARFTEGAFEFGEYDCGVDASHWMPLPSPPVP